jgi:hypothetical protein
MHAKHQAGEGHHLQGADLGEAVGAQLDALHVVDDLLHDGGRRRDPPYAQAWRKHLDHCHQ